MTIPLNGQFPFKAIWCNASSDTDVEVVGDKGIINGERYYQIKESQAAIPEREIACLSRADLDELSKSWITSQIAAEAGLQRLDHREAATVIGQSPKQSRDFTGIVFPFFEGGLGACPRKIFLFRLRRDSPDIEIGADGRQKFKNKYLSPAGSHPKIYIPPMSWGNTDSKIIYIVEGEKKALALSRFMAKYRPQALVIGLIGIYGWTGRIGKTSHNSTNKKVWYSGLIPDLAARAWADSEVYILFDSNVRRDSQNENAPKIRSARKKLTEHLVRHGAIVKWLEIPEFIEQFDDQGKTIEIFVNGIDDLLALKGPDFVERLFLQQETQLAHTSIELYGSNDQDFVPVSQEVWKLLEEAESIGNRSIFWRGNRLTRLQPMGDRAFLDNVSPNILSHRLSNLCKWWNQSKIKGRFLTTPPAKLVDYLLATPHTETPIPNLERIVTVPVFTSEGILLTDPGFHEPSGIYYLKTINLAPLPDKILPAHVNQALDLFEQDLIPDFPFSSDIDKINALGLMLLPAVREMIDGPTPFHLIEASIPSAGKGMLTKALLYPFIGGSLGTVAQPATEEEWVKVLVTMAMSGKDCFWLDNINRTLDSAALAKYLTDDYCDDRILGGNTSADSRIRFIWVGTANNPTLSREITRRTIRIRITPKTDRPEERDTMKFRHPFLMAWIKEHRAALIHAVHVLVQHWIQEGKPNGRITRGSYESYCAVIAGILEAAGLKGFDSNYRELADSVDVERASRAAFCNAWYEKILEDSKWSTAKPSDLLNIAEKIEALPIFHGDKAISTKLGRYLKGSVDICPEYSEQDEQGNITFKREFEITTAKRGSGGARYRLRLLSESGQKRIETDSEPLSQATGVPQTKDLPF
jgi:hypothetical protein